MQNSVAVRSFLLILFSVFIAAQAPAQMTQAFADKAVAKLVVVLQSRVTKLDRAAMTFHYLTMKETPKIQAKSQILDWAGSIADDFYDVNANSNELQGVGLYTAIDPHSSRGYGSPDPVLFALQLKKGAVILDLVGERDDDEQSFATVRSLASQCENQDRISGIESVTSAFRNSADLICRSIIIRAYRELGVQAILYSYSADQFADDCRFRGDSFNVIDRAALAEDNVGLFWNGGRFADLTLTRMISQTYKDVYQDFSTRYQDLVQSSSANSTPAILDSLIDVGTFERSARSWRKRNLLRCGPAWSVEGREPGEVSLILSIRSNFSDLETQNAILDWHRAYRSKIEAKTENIALYQRIKAIERKVYLQTGLPVDFSRYDDWLMVSDAFKSGGINDENEDRFAEKVLGEKVPAISAGELRKQTRSIMHELYTPARPQPGLFGAVLTRLGYGPLNIRLKLGMWNSYYGGMPLLASAPPMDASTDEAELMSANKAELLKILRQCTALMNDPSTSAESIQASDCGVRPKL